MSRAQPALDTGPLRRLVTSVGRRQRMLDSVTALAHRGFPLGLALLAASTLSARWVGSPPRWAWLALVPVVLSLGWASLRPRGWRGDARKLDAHYGLGDKIGNALEFGDTQIRRCPDPSDRRYQAIVEVLLSEAVATAATLKAAPVVPLRVPRPRLVDAAGVAMLAVAAFVPLPVATEAPLPQVARNDNGSAPTGPTPTPRVELAFTEPLRRDLRNLQIGDDPAAALAATILNLLAQLEDGTIDRADALAHLEALDTRLRQTENELEAQLDLAPAHLAEALRQMAEALEQHELTEKAGEALGRNNGDEAERELERAFDQAEHGDAATRKALEQAMRDVRRALARARAKRSDAEARLASAERRLRREQRRQPEAQSEAHERRLARHQKRVDRLRRQHKREQAARREINKLRRLARNSVAARGGQRSLRKQRASQAEMSRQTGDSSRKISRLRRMSAARDALEEARNIIRRAGRKGDSDPRRNRQRKSFVRAAKGEKGKSGTPSMLIEGRVGEDGEQPTALDNGSPTHGGDDGGGDQAGAGAADQATPDPSMLGQGAGEGSGEALGDANSRNLATRDRRVESHEGRGATRAEIIADASQEGFATLPYREVYTDYRAFAQSAMDNEALPPARRRQIRRYFQMIQPRD